MIMPSAIVLTLYTAENEPDRTVRRLVVPWGMLKRAIRLGNLVPRDDLVALLAEFFAGAVRREELESGASTVELVTCLQSIVGKAKGLVMRPATAPAEEQPDPLRAEDGGTEAEEWIHEIERSLVTTLHWSLHDLDRTDIESLFPFILGVSGGTGGRKIEKELFADQVNWL
jgi:hypothetical protein